MIVRWNVETAGTGIYHMAASTNGELTRLVDGVSVNWAEGCDVRAEECRDHGIADSSYKTHFRG